MENQWIVVEVPTLLSFSNDMCSAAQDTQITIKASPESDNILLIDGNREHAIDRETLEKLLRFVLDIGYSHIQGLRKHIQEIQTRKNLSS